MTQAKSARDAISTRSTAMRALAAGAFALGAAAIGALAAERFDNALHLQKVTRLIADRTGLAVQNL